MCILHAKKVTKFSTLCEIFNHRESPKDCLPEVHDVLNCTSLFRLVLLQQKELLCDAPNQGMAQIYYIREQPKSSNVRDCSQGTY